MQRCLHSKFCYSNKILVFVIILFLAIGVSSSAFAQWGMRYGAAYEEALRIKAQRGSVNDRIAIRKGNLRIMDSIQANSASAPFMYRHVALPAIIPTMYLAAGDPLRFGRQVSSMGIGVAGAAIAMTVLPAFPVASMVAGSVISVYDAYHQRQKVFAGIQEVDRLTYVNQNPAAGLLKAQQLQSDAVAYGAGESVLSAASLVASLPKFKINRPRFFTPADSGGIRYPTVRVTPPPPGQFALESPYKPKTVVDDVIDVTPIESQLGLPGPSIPNPTSQNMPSFVGPPPPVSAALKPDVYMPVGNISSAGMTHYVKVPHSQLYTGVARRFKSVDREVDNTANLIESVYPGLVTGIELKVYHVRGGGPLTDLDIFCPHCVIEVKSGSSISQSMINVNKQLSVLENTTGLPVIIFAPNLEAQYLRRFQNRGYLITSDPRLLLDVIRP